MAGNVQLATVSAISLADYLPVYTLTELTPVFWLSLVASYTICYLVHLKSDTSLLRSALWPIAVGANLWGVLCLDLSQRGRDSSWFPVGLFWYNSTSATIRWGRATASPTYHSLPRRPLLSIVRETTAFRALNLICDEARMITMSGSSPPIKRSDHGTLHHIARHLLCGIVDYIFMDIWTYPIYHYDPFNIGRPLSTSADWSKGIEAMCAASGMPRAVVVPAVVLSYAAGIYNSVWLLWRIFAIAGLCSGLWMPEEWPDLMDRPWMSSSLNELWGRRYHQHGLQNYARPLSFLPKYTYILRIFLMSAFYHMLCYHTRTRTYIASDMFLMFLLTGLGLEAERQYLHRTGRRVEGWKGRIWTWSWFILCGYFMARGTAEMGYVGGVRDSYAIDRRASIVEWMGYAQGWRPHPSLPLPVEGKSG